MVNGQMVIGPIQAMLLEAIRRSLTRFVVVPGVVVRS
jgi:hypothetical protein